MTPSRLVVVGASGLIGSAVLRITRRMDIPTVGTALSRLAPGLVAFDMAKAPLSSVVRELNANDVVVLLAGYISPSWIFAHPEAARSLNLDHSKRLVDNVVAAGARLLFVSTDQVFDGRTGGYSETSTPCPVNLYGQLKAAMERHVLSTTANIVARTGWNVGWEREGHCPITQCYNVLLQPGARMASDNVINVTDVDDTALGIVRLCCADRPDQLCHLVSAPEISRDELASTIQSKSVNGGRMSFVRVPFSSISYSEPRPVRAFLRSERMGGLGLTFATPRDVIARKVALLDQWHASA